MFTSVTQPPATITIATHLHRHPKTTTSNLNPSVSLSDGVTHLHKIISTTQSLSRSYSIVDFDI
ncbi:hypothetical protein Hanom_Chr02g00101551 [Helianthus anomalus]